MSEKKVKCYPWGNPIVKKIIPSQDIVSYYNKEVVKKIGERDDDFVIDHVCTEYDRMNRKDFINSHQSDVGVKNMIRKSIRNGEPVDYVMNEKFRSKQQGYVDLVEVEKALCDPDAFAKKTIESYKKIPDSIKKGKTAHDLAKMSDAELRAYVNNIISERQKKVVKPALKVEKNEVNVEKKEVK